MPHLRKGLLNLRQIVCCRSSHRQTEGARSNLCSCEVQSVRRVSRIPQYSNERCLREHLFDQLEPFRDQVLGKFRRARDIATGMRQTAHEAGRNRVKDSHHHDGGGLGRLLRGPGGDRAIR